MYHIIFRFKIVKNVFPQFYKIRGNITSMVFLRRKYSHMLFMVLLLFFIFAFNDTLYPAYMTNNYFLQRAKREDVIPLFRSEVVLVNFILTSFNLHQYISLLTLMHYRM